MTAVQQQHLPQARVYYGRPQPTQLSVLAQITEGTMPIPPNGPNGRVPAAECSVSGQEITTLGSDLTTILLTIFGTMHVFVRSEMCLF